MIKGFQDFLYKVLQFGFIWRFLIIRLSLCNFEISQKWECVFLSVSCKGHMASTCPVTGDCNFHHLVKLNSARVLHCNYFFLPLFIVSYGVILWDHVNILLFIVLSLSSFNIHWWFLPHTSITMVVVKCLFSNSLIYIYELDFYCKQKFSLLPHLFVCLFFKLLMLLKIYQY